MKRLRSLLAIEDNPDTTLSAAEADYLGLLADGEPLAESPILPLAAEDDSSAHAEILREAGVAWSECVADALGASLPFIPCRIRARLHCGLSSLTSSTERRS